MTEEDQNCWNKIKQGDKLSFKLIFHEHYNTLCFAVWHLVHDMDAAEDIVQSLFVKVWEQRKTIQITTSISSYLKTSVKNASLNHNASKKVRGDYADSLKLTENKTTAVNKHSDPYLMEKIMEVIENLPRKRKEIFKLNRLQGYKYREIAEKLNISQKTVEAQMTKAMSTLRTNLKEYVSMLLIYLWH